MAGLLGEGTAGRQDGEANSRAFSGEVDTGSPKKTRQLKKLERDPIPSNRAALQSMLCGAGMCGKPIT
jgi:hypothetical protein